MDMEQLKYVLAVAKHKHFTEAAHQICLSQSSLSKHISKVEQALGGIQLFDRTTRSVKLTAAGEEFVRHAQRIVVDFEDLQAAIREYGVLERGRLVLGTVPILGRLGLTRLVASFQRKYPGMQLEIREKKTKELIELLHRSEIDLAFLTAPIDNIDAKTITLYPLLEDEVVLVVDEYHSLATRSAISLSEAANERFIFVDPSSGMYKISINACRDAGFNPRIIYESTEIDTILGLVAERLGVALLTSRLANSFYLPNIALVPLDTPIKRTTALAVPRHSRLSGPAKAFLDHTLEWKSRER